MNVLAKTTRFAIIGSGAVGSYYGARLAQHGYDVRFLMRSDYSTVKKQGLTIQSHVGNFHLNSVNCYQNTSEIGAVDWVIIALKSTANAILPNILTPLIGPKTKLLTLQNGLGNEAFLQQHFPQQPIYGGLCFICINRLQSGLIDHQADGLISLGRHQAAIDNDLQELAQSFLDSKIPCKLENSLELARWKKLVWNIPFNGLSIAAGKLDTQQMLQSSALTQLILDLMHEVIHVAKALGHSLPESLAEQMIEKTRNMGPYKTSSLIDYMEGREVEWESIWNQPLETAKSLGLATPRLEMLTQLIAQKLGH